jgi:hypothetical protein
MIAELPATVVDCLTVSAVIVLAKLLGEACYELWLDISVFVRLYRDRRARVGVSCVACSARRRKRGSV